MHKCPTCGYRFEDAESLRRHTDEDSGCTDMIRRVEIELESLDAEEPAKILKDARPAGGVIRATQAMIDEQEVIVSRDYTPAEIRQAEARLKYAKVMQFEDEDVHDRLERYYGLPQGSIDHLLDATLRRINAAMPARFGDIKDITFGDPA